MTLLMFVVGTMTPTPPKLWITAMLCDTALLALLVVACQMPLRT